MMGPVVIDVASYELTQIEREKLQHPLVGGLILFSRNYAEYSQLLALIDDIRRASNKDMLICVDHEGGRVQRFVDNFTSIPAAGDIQRLESTSQQNELAFAMGYVMAYELLLCDIDLSFAPVLDLDRGCEVIQKRSFSSDPSDAIRLANQYIEGMHTAGMKSTGKHFPGHGSVLEDSHIAMPRDMRSFRDISDLDMGVFSQLIEHRKLDAIMPAHVIYPEVDNLPAGFSDIWLQKTLRNQLGFDGVIFSDDLSMQAATAISNIVERAQCALNAGCDMALVCNAPEQAEQVLDGLSINRYLKHGSRAKTLLQTPVNRNKILEGDMKSKHHTMKALIQRFIETD